MLTINLDFLSKFTLFHAVSTKDLEMLRSIIVVKEYSAGDIIIAEDELGTDIFILLAGEIEITQRLMLSENKSADDERNKSLARLRADQHIAVGETSLFGDGRRTATVRATSAVTMGLINRNDLLHYCDANPAFGFKLFYNFGGILSKRLADANRNIMKLSTAFVLALERGR